VKKLSFVVTPVKTGVQSIVKALKTLDSGFRRNDVKKNQIDLFTASLFSQGGGGKGGGRGILEFFTKTAAVLGDLGYRHRPLFPGSGRR
jgi:hypothetical protein